MTEELFQKMSQSILDGDSDAAVALANQAIQAGIDPLDAITKGFVIGVNQVGEILPLAMHSCLSWLWLVKL